MATAADVRAGIEDAPARGFLARRYVDQWNSSHPDDPYMPAGNIPDDPAATTDYPDDDFDTGFPGDDTETGSVTAPAGDPGEELKETAPQRPGSSRKGKTGKRAGLRNPFARSKTGSRKKAAKRVSTETFLGSLWRAGAKLATPLPPLQRTLRVQAPVAGMLLEDAVRGTAADAVLQPFARFAEGGKTVTALLGPPAFVTAIMVEQQRAAAENRDPNPLFMAVALEGLRGSLMTWCEVAGPKFEVAMRKEMQFEEQYGKSVDEMMEWLFSPPVLRTEDAIRSEEEAIRRAQGIL